MPENLIATKNNKYLLIYREDRNEVFAYRYGSCVCDVKIDKDGRIHAEAACYFFIEASFAYWKQFKVESIAKLS